MQCWHAATNTAATTTATIVSLAAGSGIGGGNPAVVAPVVPSSLQLPQLRPGAKMVPVKLVSVPGHGGAGGMRMLRVSPVKISGGTAAAAAAAIGGDTAAAVVTATTSTAAGVFKLLIPLNMKEGTATIINREG